jgi:serine/threonine-protein kinase
VIDSSPNAPPADVDLPSGTSVGEYRVERRLAAGGMGTVYAAVHPVIGKRAAVKVLKAEHSKDAHLIQRFVDEARAVNHIGHDHIVDIFAFGSLPDGRSFFVMEWLDGQSLKQASMEGEVSFFDGVEILLQLCDALDAAHRKSIIHRDLKPDNVFLERTNDGRVSVKLLDFGIAKLGHRPSGGPDTNPDLVMGTPDYIAPEQAMGHATDAPADVYSLGVMAWELFLGRRPFSGASPLEVMVKHISHAPPAPAELRADVPDCLASLLSRLLSKEPADRPTLRQLRRALAEMRTAARLCGFDVRPSSPRPVLLRHADGVGPLASALVAELNAGAAWVSAAGSPPAVGSPIRIRFRSLSSGFELDFFGVVGGVFGAGADRVLVRYDRVRKPTLDRIVEAASEADAGRIEAEWSADDAIQPSWAQFLRTDAPAMREDVVPTEEAPRPEPRTAPTPAEPDRTADPLPSRPWFGLGARMMALTSLVVLGAVVGVTLVALRQSRIDREFYVQDQNLTTARALQEALTRQSDLWRKQLALTLATNRYEGPGDEFSHLSICGRTGCRPVIGDRLPTTTIDIARSRLEEESAVLPVQDGLLVVEGAPDRWALAVVDPASLKFLGAPAPNVDVALVGAEGPVLARFGAPAGPDPSAHPVVSLARSAPEAFGARGYEGPDGQAYLGAWSRADRLAVVVIRPARVTLEQIQVLSQQVLIVAATGLGIALSLAFLLSTTTTRRIRSLARSARRVAQGDFTGMASLRGRDEVAELGRYFAEMTRALRARDEQVLEAQKIMNADEVRLVQKSLSEWLQRDLASRLERMRHLLSGPTPGSGDAAELRELTDEASRSLQSALLFAASGRARNDLVTIARDAVEAESSRPGPSISFGAHNAALLPWLDADESRLRELTRDLIARTRGAARTSVAVQLWQDDRGSLVLRAVFDGDPAAADPIAAQLRLLATEQGARVGTGSEEGAAVWLEFPRGHR